MIQRFRLCAYTLEGTGLIVVGVGVGVGVELRFRMPSVQKKKKKGFSGPEFEALRWAAAWPRLLVS